MVTRLKAGASVLDLGCCFGQDLRYLAFDGVPTTEMFASDIVRGFWDLSYDLYCDASRMKAKFIEADILDLEISPHLMELRGRLDIILANQLFHLFDWNRQVKVAVNLVKLSNPKTWIIGHQIGSSIGRAIPVHPNTGGEAGGAGSTTKFFHTPKTWQAMWRQVEESTGTKWEIESSSIPLKEWGVEDEDSAWMGPNARGFQFFARRTDNVTADSSTE